MNEEIIRPSGNLKREVWHFNLGIDSHPPCIRLAGYSFQTRETTRHRIWKKQTHWDKYDRRSNNIDTPPLPADVDREIHEAYQEFIDTLSITTS